MTVLLTIFLVGRSLVPAAAPCSMQSSTPQLEMSAMGDGGHEGHHTSEQAPADGISCCGTADCSFGVCLSLSALPGPLATVALSAVASTADHYPHTSPHRPPGFTYHPPIIS